MISFERNAKLSLVIALKPGQTLASLVSACAAHNGFRSANRFCKAFGIDAAGLAAGRPDMLEKLARLLRTEAASLRDAGTWVNGTTYNCVGQRLERKQFRAVCYVCPQCLEDDQRASPELRIDAAIRDRAPWIHAFVEACPIHGLRLFPLPTLEGQLTSRRDLAAQFRALEHPLPRIPATPNPVELYIYARFTGAVSGCPFLDDFELDDALFLARYLGAGHQAGEKTAASEKQPLVAIGRGLTIAALGLKAVEARLREIAIAINPHGACEIGLRRVFGELFDRIESRIGADMLVIRSMLVAIGLEQHLFPFDQTEALGLALPPRQAESIETARKRFGISDRVMRAILDELGVMPSNHAAQSSNTIMVSLAEFAPLLGELKDCLNLAQAARALGLLPAQLLKLSSQSGVIEPFFTRPSSDLKPLRYFRKGDLDAFMKKITSHCSRATETSGLVDMWEAGLKACRQPSDVVAAVANGRIPRTFRVRKVETLRDVLVDPNDVRAALAETADNDLVDAEDSARSLAVNVQAMRKIMQSGILPSQRGANPINQRAQLCVRQVDLSAFHSTFVSLTALRQQWRKTAPFLAIALKEAGVKPAFPIELSGVGLYRRSDLSRARSRIEAVMTERIARYG